MEFSELATCQFKQNSIHPFSLVSSGFHVGMLGSTSEAIVLEMRHSSQGIHSIPYRVDTVKLPTIWATSDVVNKINLAAIYLKTNPLKRQYIALDPVYVSELSEEPIKCQPVAIEWAPKNFFFESTLAIVSNNGACELRCRDSINREWNIVVCSLNKFYYEVFPFQNPDKIDTFEKLKETVENYCTTSFSWNMNSNEQPHLFVTTNATGWLLLFMVSKGGLIQFCSKYKTSLGRVSCVYFVKNFVLACSTNGILQMFTLEGNAINKVETLWHKADRMPCKKVSMSFSETTDKWILVTSKGSHALVFILSTRGVVELKATRYLGNIEITGFEMLSTYEYIFVTFTGLIKLLKIKIIDDNLQIDMQDVMYTFDKTNYQILGLVSSPNKVAWTFLLYHNKPYTYPSIFSPKDAILSVCSLNIKDPFKILKDDFHLKGNALDCAEIVRLDILKNNITMKFEKLSIDDVKINTQFFQKLQLKLLIVNVSLSYQRLKYNHVKKAGINELNSLTRIIECVFINLRLQFLRGEKCYTNFQLISGKCLKYKLKSLQAELISKEDVFRNVQENLNTLSDCLLMDLGSLFESAEESCSYCDQPINFDTMMCSSSHSVSRCSISYLQVPLFSRVFCSSCNRLYIDKIELLKSVFSDDDDVQCTFCGFSFDIDMRKMLDALII